MKDKVSIASSKGKRFQHGAYLQGGWGTALWLAPSKSPSTSVPQEVLKEQALPRAWSAWMAVPSPSQTQNATTCLVHHHSIGVTSTVGQWWPLGPEMQYHWLLQLGLAVEDCLPSVPPVLCVLQTMAGLEDLTKLLRSQCQCPWSREEGRATPFRLVPVHTVQRIVFLIAYDYIHPYGILRITCLCTYIHVAIWISMWVHVRLGKDCTDSCSLSLCSLGRYWRTTHWWHSNPENFCIHMFEGN